MHTFFFPPGEPGVNHLPDNRDNGSFMTEFINSPPIPVESYF